MDEVALHVGDVDDLAPTELGDVGRERDRVGVSAGAPACEWMQGWAMSVPGGELSA